MATLTRLTLTEVGSRFAGTTGGQDITANGVTPTLVTGDLIPINTGRGTLVIITSAGTGATATFDSVVVSQYGNDQDVAVTVPATGLTVLFLTNDGVSRFDQGGGSASLAKVVFSANTNIKLYAVVIP